MFRFRSILAKATGRIRSRRIYVAAGLAVVAAALLSLNLQQPKIRTVHMADKLGGTSEILFKLPEGVVASNLVSTSGTADSTKATGTPEQTDADGTPITENGLPRHNYDPSVVPKSTKSLIVSPSTVVMYRSANGFYPQGLKPGIMDGMSVQISTSDGAMMVVPFSQDGAGVLQPADRVAAAATWNFTVSTTYASFGTHTYTITSRTPSGTTAYTGTIQVEVRQMPVFTATITQQPTLLVGTDGGTDALVTGISYDFTNAAGYEPSVSIEMPAYMVNVSCSNVTLAPPNGIRCTLSRPLSAGSYLPSVIFENQYQRIVLPG